MRDFLLSNRGDVARHKAAHAGALYRAVQPSPNVDYNGLLTPGSRPRVLGETTQSTLSGLHSALDKLASRSGVFDACFPSEASTHVTLYGFPAPLLGEVSKSLDLIS
jgi:hypothetical protein